MFSFHVNVTPFLFLFLTKAHLKRCCAAYHVLGDAEYHLDVRQQCIEYMEKNRDDFQDFVPGDFDEYLEHKAKSTTYGNHLEIQALSELYNRTIEVYSYSTGKFFLARVMI